MSRPQFATVIFHLKKDIFPTNTSIDCEFEITESLEANKWDWIGMYPVAWRSQKDYVAYQYVSLPEDYQKGKKAFSKITWDAGVLPRDEEYYQLCYISRQLNCICGASDPFQFSSSTGREYVEEECEDMMVVRPKTDVMQDEIQKLSHKLLLVGKEREELQGKVGIMEKTMTVRDSIICQLQKEVKLLEEQDDQEKEKNKQLVLTINDLTKKQSVLHKEKDSIEQALGKEKMNMVILQDQIQQLKENIRTLQSERDELSGQNQSLTDELNSYKIQVMDSQTKVTQTGKTISKLNEELEKALNQCATVVEECEDLKKKVAEKEEILRQLDNNLASVMQQKIEAERRRNDLTHELQNANDKLLACDAMKVKLSSDLEAYEQTQQKMNCKFEDQESEMRIMRDKLEHKERAERDSQKMLAQWDKELEKMRIENKQLRATLNEFEQVMAMETSCKDGLTKANEKLKLDYSSICRQLDILTAQLKSVSEEKMALQMQLRSFEDELQETLVLKDKEVAGRLDELRDKTQQIRNKDQELARRKQIIEELKEQVAKLTDTMQEEKRKLLETQEVLCTTKENLLQVVEAQATQGAKWDQLQREGQEYAKRCQEAEKALEEMKAQKEEAVEREASTYCLWKAHDALKARLEAREKELSQAREEVREAQEEVQRQQSLIEEQAQTVEELTNRLELGKLEFKTQAMEKEKLARRLQKETTRKVRRSSDNGPEGSLSDTDAVVMVEVDGAKKYKSLYKKEKKEKEVLLETLKLKDDQLQELAGENFIYRQENEDLRNQIKSLQDQMIKLMAERRPQEEELTQPQDEVDTDEDEEEEEEEQAQSVQLMYGNPYAPKVEAATEPPSQQTIIRSTLEEEAEAESADPMSAASGEGNQLPPPLEPEVVTAHGAAASCDADDAVAEEGVPEVFEDCPSAMPADDSFLDAIEEGMVCPFCHHTVMASNEFKEHMATHLGRMCPVCCRQADDNVSPDQLQQHVNRCLDKGSACGAGPGPKESHPQ
ncbi:uncharacterized protein LOC143290551 [Babylonia areolata]|uniref:uncharacterized protein LOC143290551 n=1 Tax=Babylonia areolata TaxID=304850 RepID=UPI003FD04564